MRDFAPQRCRRAVAHRRRAAGRLPAARLLARHHARVRVRRRAGARARGRGAGGDGALRRAELGPGGRAAPRHHAPDRAPHRDQVPRSTRGRSGSATKARSCVWNAPRTVSASSFRWASSWPGGRTRRRRRDDRARGRGAGGGGCCSEPTIDLGHLGLARGCCRPWPFRRPRWRRPGAASPSATARA